MAVIISEFHYYQNDSYSMPGGQMAKIWYNKKADRYDETAEFIAREFDETMSRTTEEKAGGHALIEAWYRPVDGKAKWDKMVRDYDAFIIKRDEK